MEPVPAAHRLASCSPGRGGANDARVTSGKGGRGDPTRLLCMPMLAGSRPVSEARQAATRRASWGQDACPASMSDGLLRVAWRPDAGA